MKIYSVDFEKVVKNYKSYVSEMLELEQFKMTHQTEMEMIKKDMESIIASSQSGLIVDENIQKSNIQRFKDLQMSGSKKENDFRAKFTQKQNDIMEASFEAVSSLMNEYSKSSDIDMIVSKSQLVFVKDEFDITNDILGVLKDKGLYYENEKES